MRRLLPLALILSACTPAEVLKGGQKLLALGRIADACEVYQRGQAHFPNNADIAAARATTCPQALQGLAADVQSALGRGDIQAARGFTDRMGQLFAGHAETRRAEQATVDAWASAARQSFDRGDDAHAVAITRDMLGWSSLSRGWSHELLTLASDRAVQQGRSSDFAGAHASLNAYTHLADPTGVIAGARAQLNGMEAGQLSLRAEQASDLATAWMLARAAAARDGRHTALVQRIESQWRETHSIPIAMTVQDPAARALVDDIARATRTDLVRWTDAQAAAMTLTISHLTHQCTDQVQNLAANHAYIAGYRDLPNPTWVALDHEATSLDRDRDRAQRDLRVAEGALGPSRAAVARAETEVARVSADRAAVHVRRDRIRDDKARAQRGLDAATNALNTLQTQQQASRDQETQYAAARDGVREARQRLASKQEAARAARGGRSPSAATSACRDAEHEREVQACKTWQNAVSEVERAQQAVSDAEARLERLSRTERIEVRSGDIAAARRAVEQARAEVNRFQGQLNAMAETLDVHNAQVRHAERDLRAAEQGLQAASAAVDASRDTLNTFEQRLRSAMARRDATPRVVTEAIEAVQPYVVERWTRTCTADIAGQITADGQRLPVREQVSLSMSDDTWASIPTIGLHGDALGFRMNAHEAYSSLDVALRDAVIQQVDSTLSGMLAARSNPGPHTSESDAMLMGMFAGLRPERELTAYAQRTIGAGW